MLNPPSEQVACRRFDRTSWAASIAIMSEPQNDFWAYRAGSGKPVVQVDVLVRGEKHPRRAKIQFVDDRFEGKTEWVPARRLLCPWGELDQLLETEAAWDDLKADGRADRGECDAAFYLFHELCPTLISIYGGLAMGIGEVYDVAGLAHRLGWPESRLTGSPGAMKSEEGSLLLRWFLTREIAQVLALANPHLVSEMVERGRRETRRNRAERDEYVREVAPWYSDEEVLEAVNRQIPMVGPVLAVLNRWTGRTEEEQRDEDFQALKADFDRLARLALQAVPDVRRRRSQRAEALAQEIEQAARVRVPRAEEP